MGISEKILKGEKKEIAIGANILIKTGDKNEIKILCDNLHSASEFSKTHIKKILQVHGDKDSIEPLCKTLLEELEKKEEQKIKESSLTLYLILRRTKIKDPDKAKKIIEILKTSEINKKYLYLVIGGFGKEAASSYLEKQLSAAPEDEKPFILKGLILTKYGKYKEIIMSQEINLLKESIYEILDDDDLTNYLVSKIRNLGEDFIEKMFNIIKNGKPRNSKIIVNEMIKDTNSPFFNDFLELAKIMHSEDTIKIIENLLESKRKENIEKALFSAYIEIKGEDSINFILKLFPHKTANIQAFVLNEYFSKFKKTNISPKLSYEIKELWLKLFKIGENEDLKVAVLKSFGFLTFEKEEDYIFVKGEILNHYKKNEEVMPSRIKNNIGLVLKTIQKKIDAIHMKKVILAEIDKYIELFEKEKKEEYLKNLSDKISNIEPEGLKYDYRKQKEKYFLKFIEENISKYSIVERSLKILEKIGTKESLPFLEKLRMKTDFYGVKVLIPKIIEQIRLSEGLSQKMSFIYENLFYLKKILKESLEKFGFKTKEIDNLSILDNINQRFHSIFIDIQNLQSSKDKINGLIGNSKFDFYIIIYLKEEELEGLSNDKIIKLKKPFSKETVGTLIEKILI